MIDLTFTNATTKKTYSRKFFLAVIEQVARELKLKNPGLSINLVGQAKIKALNKQYRHKDKPTDVLSFPLSERLNQRAKILELGDIFICPNIVMEKVKQEIYPAQDREGYSDSNLAATSLMTRPIGTFDEPQRDPVSYGMAWVTVHGMLHLLGYDHERSTIAEKKMFALQDKILTKL